MTLSNTEIWKAIDDKRIVIKPNPTDGFKTTAVDLHLGSRFRIPKKAGQVRVCPDDGSIADTLGALYDLKEIRDDEEFKLEPSRLVLGITMERVSLPLIPDSEGHCLAARVEGKSSRARLGLLVHFTAPTIHAGFEGQITLEMINLGNFLICLKPGMAICQLIFERVLGEPSPHDSEFQGQNDPAGVVQ